MRCRRTAAHGDRLRSGGEATDADVARPTADKQNGVGGVLARAVAPVVDSVGLKASKISWEHFYTLVVFVRTGSLRRAGVEMNIHPSTVWRRVEALERQLGVSLFRREHHELRITQAGRSALERAEHIAAEIADLERTLSGMDDQLAGKVRIGVPCELAACMIDSINEFEQANRAIDVEIRSIAADTDLDSLDIDCAIAVTDHPPGHLIGRLLGRLTAAAYASAAYLDQHDPAGAPEACAGIQLTSVGGRACDPMKHLLPDVPVRTRCDDVGCVLHARAGMGVAALPCMLGDSEPLLAPWALGSSICDQPRPRRRTRGVCRNPANECP